MAPRHQAEWLVAKSAAVSSAAIRGGVGASTTSRILVYDMWCMTYKGAHISWHSIKHHHKGHRDFHPYRNLDFVANLSMAWHRKSSGGQRLRTSGVGMRSYRRISCHSWYSSDVACNQFNKKKQGVSRAISCLIRDHPTSPTLSLQQKMTWK